VQEYNSYGKSMLINESCLNSSKYLKKESIDLIITSPPYPNDLEYTRQTRLELYLLDFVSNMADVQRIKRKMTKGSTKLLFRESDSEKFVASINSIRNVSDAIYEETKDKNWGFDYPRMIREYFGDMYLCLKEYYPLMKEESHFLLVVGDQTIKGVFVPVCDILIELASEIGYKNCRKELHRVRRSTGHDIPLPEEIIILEK
jgi:DNA modification methylase